MICQDANFLPELVQFHKRFLIDQRNLLTIVNNPNVHLLRGIVFPKLERKVGRVRRPVLLRVTEHCQERCNRRVVAADQSKPHRFLENALVHDPEDLAHRRRPRDARRRAVHSVHHLPVVLHARVNHLVCEAGYHRVAVAPEREREIARAVDIIGGRVGDVQLIEDRLDLLGDLVHVRIELVRVRVILGYLLQLGARFALRVEVVFAADAALNREYLVHRDGFVEALHEGKGAIVSALRVRCVQIEKPVVERFWQELLLLDEVLAVAGAERFVLQHAVNGEITGTAIWRIIDKPGVEDVVDAARADLWDCAETRGNCGLGVAEPGAAAGDGEIG